MSKVSDRAAHSCRNEQLASLNRARCRRGRSLFRARAPHIWRVGSYTYRVPSQAAGGIYNVCLKPGSEHCTCPDFARYGANHGRLEAEPGDFACKHLYAALMARIKTQAALKEVTAA